MNKECQVIFHPVRFRICKALEKNKEMYIEEISKSIGVNARLISHHMDRMQKLGLVGSTYKLVRRKNQDQCLAVRVCRLKPLYFSSMRGLKINLQAMQIKSKASSRQS